MKQTTDARKAGTLVPAEGNYPRPAMAEPIVGEYYRYAPSTSAVARSYVMMLARQRWVMLGVFICVVALGIFFLRSCPPKYTAVAEVLVTPIDKGGGGASPNLADNISTMMRVRSVATQAKLMSSPDLLHAAFAALPVTLRQSGFTSSADNLAAYPVAISNPKDTDIVAVEVTARDPLAAAAFANQIVRTALERRRENVRAIAGVATEHVDAEIARCEAELNRTRAALTALKRDHGIVDLGAQTTADAQALAQLETQAAQADLDLDRARRTRLALGGELGALREVIESARTTADNPILRTIDNQIEALEQQRAALLQEYQPTAPEVRAVDEQIAAANGRKAAAINAKTETVTQARNPVIDNLRLQYVDALVAEQANQHRAARLRAQGAAVRARIGALPAFEQQWAGLASRAQELSNTHAFLITQQQSLNLSMHGGLPNVMSITQAKPDFDSATPNVPAALVLIIALAGLLALGAGLLREQLDDRIHTAEALQTQAESRLLASLPRIRNGLRGLVTEHACPQSLLESFRILRGNIFHALPTPLPQIIMVTSAHAGEGKSTTVANLALTIALSNRRVLIIDGDLRHPSIHLAYGMANEAGLSDILQGDAMPEACIRQTPYGALHILTAGGPVTFTTELLASPAMTTFLEEMRAQYDCVLLDSTPLLHLSDGTPLAAQADGVIVVVSSHRTRQAEVHETLRLLEQIGSPVLGLVYNRAQDVPALQWR